MAPVIQIRAEVHIKSSAESTWTYLTDPSTWPQWNTFIPEANVIDTVDKAHGASALLRLGSRCRFAANIRGRKWGSVQKVTVFEKPEPRDAGSVYRIVWEAQGYPSWLFRTVRFNEIEEVVTEDGKECIYRTGEDQSGPLAYFIRLVFGKEIKRGIERWAEDLKRVAEG